MNAEAPLEPLPTTLANTNSGSSTSSSERSSSQTSHDRSSSATSKSSLSDRPYDEQDSDDHSTSGQDLRQPDKSVVVDIVPPSILKGYVLFGVLGSKRLQSARLRLAQIDVEVFKDDDSFFDEMTVQYRKLRGYVRWILSMWQFHTCEFVMVRRRLSNGSPSILRLT